MIRHFLTKEFLRFLLVGTTAAAGNWISRIVFNMWTDSFALSVVIAYAVAMAIAFGYLDSFADVRRQLREVSK